MNAYATDLIALVIKQCNIRVLLCSTHVWISSYSSKYSITTQHTSDFQPLSITYLETWLLCSFIWKKHSRQKHLNLIVSNNIFGTCLEEPFISLFQKHFLIFCIRLINICMWYKLILPSKVQTRIWRDGYFLFYCKFYASNSRSSLMENLILTTVFFLK